MDRLDELLHDFEFNLRQGFINNTEKKRKQILALLRAGAEMRGRVHLEWQHPTLGYRPMYVDDEIAKYAQAWDAALGGEDE